MSFYWASAASFVFFILLGVIGGSVLHLQGSRWYFFMGLMAALGLSAAALFYYFQRRAQKRGQSGSGGVAAAGGAAEADPMIHEANARLAQSKTGTTVANPNT